MVNIHENEEPSLPLPATTITTILPDLLRRPTLVFGGDDGSLVTRGCCCGQFRSDGSQAGRGGDGDMC